MWTYKYMINTKFRRVCRGTQEISTIKLHFSAGHGSSCNYRPVIPALGKLGEEDGKFEATLDYLSQKYKQKESYMSFKNLEIFMSEDQDSLDLSDE
jgi:hypothetical protein